MPRKKKKEELESWLSQIDLYVFKIENEVIKTLYMSNTHDVNQLLKDRYGKNLEVTYLGRISEIHLQGLSTSG